MSRMFPLLCTLLTLSLSWRTLTAGEVTLSKGAQTVKATIDGEAFLAYQFDVGRLKPFFLPIAAANGFQLLKKQIEHPGNGDSQVVPGAGVFVVQEQAQVFKSPAALEAIGVAEFGSILTTTDVKPEFVFVQEKQGWMQQADVVPLAASVTRLINDNPPQGLEPKDPRFYDHLHHKGLWFAVDEVNGIEFWAEKGKIINQGVEIDVAHGDPAVMTAHNEWRSNEGTTIVHETARIRIFSNRLIDYVATFAAGEGPATFGDTKEGLFAIRLPNSMREMVAGGPVENADGLHGTAECWGKPSAWVDYRGPIDGATFGVAIMDSPNNFRPARYHVRDYGLFAINPFGNSAYTNGAEPSQPVTLKPGEKLTLEYGLFVHDGDAPQSEIQSAYQQFVKAQ